VEPGASILYATIITLRISMLSIDREPEVHFGRRTLCFGFSLSAT
jgi:hypothetical protein